MKVTVTVLVRVELEHGGVAETTRTVTRHAGGNPSFLRQEVGQAIEEADRFALDGLCASVPGAGAPNAG